MFVRDTMGGKGEGAAPSHTHSTWVLQSASLENKQYPFLKALTTLTSSSSLPGALDVKSWPPSLPVTSIQKQLRGNPEPPVPSWRAEYK